MHLGHWRETSVAIKSLAPVLARRVPHPSQLASLRNSRKALLQSDEAQEGGGGGNGTSPPRVALDATDSLLSSQSSMLASLEQEVIPSAAVWQGRGWGVMVGAT